VETLLGAIGDREQRSDQVRAQLAELEGLDQVATLDTVTLKGELTRLLSEWQGWIGGHNAQARHILQKLVIGRLTFTPRVEDRRPFYEFKGVGALEPILAGVLPPRAKQWCPRRGSYGWRSSRSRS
jgi:hypothetical protein